MQSTSQNSGDFLKKDNTWSLWENLKKQPIGNSDIDLEKLFISLVTYGIIPTKEWVDYIIQSRIIFEYQMLFNPRIYSILEDGLGKPLSIELGDKTAARENIEYLRELKRKWGTRDIDDGLQIAIRTNGDMNSYIITHAGKAPKE